MRKTCAELGRVATLALALAACGDSSTIPREDAGKAEPAPNDGDDRAPGTVEEATWHDAWRHCAIGSGGECLAFESCVGVAENTATVCASLCETLADCVNLSALPAAPFTAQVACQELSGARRCVLGCDDHAQCPALALCEAGACVWPRFSECEAADGQYALLVHRLREGRTDCERDEECTLLRPSLDCPAGARIEGCGIVVARGHTLDIQADLNVLDQVTCALAPRDCVAAPSCPPVEPRCVASECTGVISDGGV